MLDEGRSNSVVSVCEKDEFTVLVDEASANPRDGILGELVNEFSDGVWTNASQFLYDKEDVPSPRSCGEGLCGCFFVLLLRSRRGGKGGAVLPDACGIGIG